MAFVTASEVTHEFHFFRVYKDGRIEFLLQDSEKIRPFDDPVTGVQSKDVIISPEPQVSARIFLPKLKNPNQKFPLLFYIHGGGFCLRSAFSHRNHNFCSQVAAKADFIVVSVEYGLFPARPLPACYEDSWTALQWVASHASGNGPEPWLKDHADFDRVSISGNSAGGNIAHTLAFRVGTIGLPEGVKVVGMALVQPFFGGSEEEKMWLYMCPTNSGSDDPRLNPGMEDLAKIGCQRVLIFVAEKDALKVVAKNYYEKLKKSGFKGGVEIVEHESEGHTFHLKDPKSEKAGQLMEKLVSFLKQE
ncbi:unnamed protein product [Dovyalis caffra]|uniref:Alpha/beta hydrolase fold-3 domain-containing protein n=1 Tax=Dovyalis caffra TaxID=77055 RepID=A0AAV1RC81_9ROSI|nr:unnamed protein product [Dovyalis caffra]